MGNQSASRLEGDRYQHLYSWFELLRLLPVDSPFTHGLVEHPAVGAADDITLLAAPGGGSPGEFTQVKWHVDHSDQYHFELLAAVPKGAKTSILEKLHASHGKLAGSGAFELCFLSNWGARPEFGAFIDARTERLSAEFFTDNTKVAKQARALWCSALNVKLPELEQFCRNLRFRLGFGSLTELEQRVDERMALHGLVTGSIPRHVITDAVAEWIEVGGRRKELDRAALLREIDRLRLRAPVANEPKVSLHVHGWTRTQFDQTPTVELDWTSHFARGKRGVAGPDVWRDRLLPELAVGASKLRTLSDGLFVDVRGKVPLTASLAIGFTLSDAAGFKLKTEQSSSGTPQRWSTLACPSDARMVVGSQRGGTGPRMLVGIEVSACIGHDLDQFAAQTAPSFDSVTCLRPANGAAETAVRSESDAVALALSTKQLLRDLRRQLQGREIHLVLCCPAALALFIGHRLNALGVVYGYERTIDGGYRQSLQLETG